MYDSFISRFKFLSDTVVAHPSRKMGSFNYARKPCPRLDDHDFATWVILQNFGMAEPSDRFELRGLSQAQKAKASNDRVMVASWTNVSLALMHQAQPR